MYTKDSFTKELKLIWDVNIKTVKPKGYKRKHGLDVDWEIADAWEIYFNALNSSLPMLLLGETKLRSQIEVMKNFGTTSATMTTMERGTLGKIATKDVTRTLLEPKIKEKLEIQLKTEITPH